MAIEVAQAFPKDSPDAKGFWRTALERFSTGVGSAKDILDLNPWAKGAITIFKELVDIWKGKAS